MAAKTSVLKGPKDVVAKTRSVARTMTTGTAIMTLPKGSRFLYAIIAGVPSDAGTTATVSLGTTATATELVSGHDVKTAATGRLAFMVTGAATSAGTVFTTDQVIYAIYAESGAASAAGAWKVTVFYSTGNITNDDTL
jgi:hypothetical protein